MKRIFATFAILLLGGAAAFCQQAYLGASLGTSVFYIKQDFVQNGHDAPLTYTAPGVAMDLEMSSKGGFFMSLPFSILFSPFSVNLDGKSVDLHGYTTKMAIDFSCNVGYLHPINDKLSLGGGGGLHVCGPSLSPSDGDPTKLTIAGMYYLVGVDFILRARYKINDHLMLTCSVPFGIDMTQGKKEENEYVTIYPYSLTPKNSGIATGVTLTVGYLFPFLSSNNK